MDLLWNTLSLIGFEKCARIRANSGSRRLERLGVDQEFHRVRAGLEGVDVARRLTENSIRANIGLEKCRHPNGGVPR